MSRHKIPGDRVVKDPSGTSVVERDQVEISGTGVAITTPDADTAQIAISGGGGGGLAITPRSGTMGIYYGRQYYIYVNGISITTSATINLSSASPTIQGGTFMSGYTSLASSAFYLGEAGLYSVAANVSHASNSPANRWSIYAQISKAGATAAQYQLSEGPVQYRRDSATDRHDAGLNLTDWFEIDDGFQLKAYVPSDMATITVDVELTINKII